MASIKKVVDKMKRQPNGIRFDEVDRVLRHYGYHTCRKRGSHMNFINDSGDVITIAKRTPTIKSAYVNSIIERLGL